MLPSWYPSRLSPFNGDFIKRHAEAVSLYEDVHVIYVVKDEKGMLTNDVLIEESVNGRLTETIIYYYISPKTFSIIEKLFSERKYRNLHKEAINRYLEQKGKPELVHVHVGMKAGVIARWLKKRKNIPYVVTEHWSGFLKEAKEKFNDLPFYLRSAWRKVIQNAVGCSVVSQYLAKAIMKHFAITFCKVIPNVVNTDIFYPEIKIEKNTIRFIHVSGLDTLKNPKAILQAFQIVVKNYPDATLEIFGSQRTDIFRYAATLQLQNNVHFHPEVPQTVLAGYLRRSDVLILYSSYETFGCVIIEANACGVPVIVSDIPVFHEIIKEGENGCFVPTNDPAALAERMIWLVINRSLFNNNSIASMTWSKYSYETIGKQFSDWYQEILRGF
jgi:glycosyltransferase involved in cell wall biosynthesis